MTAGSSELIADAYDKIVHWEQSIELQPPTDHNAQARLLAVLENYLDILDQAIGDMVDQGGEDTIILASLSERLSRLVSRVTLTRPNGTLTASQF